MCSDPLDRGIWTEVMSFKYFFNKAKGKCEGFHYTGGGVSANRFDSMQECLTGGFAVLATQNISSLRCASVKKVITTAVDPIHRWCNASLVRSQVSQFFLVNSCE